MYLAYSPSTRSVVALSQALEDFSPLESRTEWDEVARLATRSKCLIVRLEDLGEASHRNKLHGINTLHPALPIILVTRPDPESLRYLKNIRAEEVLWITEMKAKLSRVVREVTAHNSLVNVQSVVKESIKLPGGVRQSLLMSLDSTSPYLDQVELARLCGISRSTLHREWTRTIKRGKGISFKTAIDIILLLRITSAKAKSVKTWESLCEEYGVGIRTLRRIARRHAGKRLSEIGRREEVRLEKRLVNVLTNAP